MKIRKLKSMIDVHGYIARRDEDTICIGSPLCHNLISYDPGKGLMRAAMDPFHKGRASLNNDELLDIWDNLEKVAKTEEFRDILSGKDEIDNPTTGYTFRQGRIVEIKTESGKLEWPNIDDDGYLIYDNEYFKTKDECIQHAMNSSMFSIETLLDVLSSNFQKIADGFSRIHDEIKVINRLNMERNNDEDSSSHRDPDSM